MLVAFVGLASLYALTVPGFAPADETSHTGQALLVARGELPALDTPTPDAVPGMALYFELRQQLYTANHPPLYYGVVGVPLRLGVALERPLLGFVAARLATVLLAAVAGVATWNLARTLLPGRRELPVLAAALVLLVPIVPRVSGTLYNDGFGLAAFAVLLWIAVELLVRGPSRGRLAAAAVAAATVALTRSIGLGGVALLAVAVLLAHLVHRRGPATGRLLAGAWRSAVVVGVAALASGWFWIRNHRRYGDLAGTQYNLERFEYERDGSVFDFLFRLDKAAALGQDLWGRMYDEARFTATGWGLVPVVVFGVLVLGGAIAIVVRLLRRRSTGAADPALPLADDAGRRLAWLLLAGWSAAVWASVLSYNATGGGLHARYLFPALPALAVLVAAALGALPGWRRGWAPAASVATMVSLGVVWSFALADRFAPAGSSAIADLTANASAANDVAAAPVWLALVLAVAGGAATCWSLVVLAGEPVPAGSVEGSPDDPARAVDRPCADPAGATADPAGAAPGPAGVTDGAGDDRQ